MARPEPFPDAALLGQRQKAARRDDAVDGRRNDADHREQDQADQDLGALRPAQEPQQLVEDEGHHGHVDHFGRTDVAGHLQELEPEVLDLLDEVHSPNISASRAICAYRRLPACWKTTDRGPSMTSSVTSSPRWAGRQCMKTASGARSITAWLTW